MKRIISFLLVSVLALPAFANPYPYGAPKPPYTNPPPVAVAPNSLEIGGQYYDGTPNGMRQYLETIRESQPDIYAGLNEDVSSLQSKQRTANWLGWGGIAVGMTCILGSATFLAAKETDQFTGVERTVTNTGILAAGVVVSLGGTIAALVIAPSRNDMLETINKHNRLNPSKQLKWQLGLRPLIDGSALVAQIEF